jgi:isopentenyl diphosphate isomerase/L-lactate dehydrogenase-like FMN-dependent dehydrogenase
MQFGRTTIQALRVACLLTGSASIAELQEAPRVLGPNLRRWTEARAGRVSPRH